MAPTAPTGATLAFLAVLLAGCGQIPTAIERTEALVHIKLVEHIDYKPGYTALGMTRCANGVCVVEVLRDQYPSCLLHELRHVFEGDWHEGRETTWDCD